MKTKIEEILESKNINLTKSQKEAVMHEDGPALVLSVPGSGKTTVVISRIGNLILNKKAKAEDILAITFSKASAVDMTERYNKIFGDMNFGRVRFSTIHALGHWVVTSYNRKFGVNQKIIESSEIHQVIKKAYNEDTQEYLAEDRLEGYVSAMSYIKNRMLGEDEISKYADDTGLESFSYIYYEYEKYKKKNNLIDFDDMLYKTVQILEQNEITRKYLKDKYKYIILDEGQDTTPLQYRIIELIVNDSKNIYIVADDDQSIYGWRGADSSILLNIDKMFPNTKLYNMEQNFRSSRNIINVANAIIKNNEKRYKKVIQTAKDNGNKVNVVSVYSSQEQYKYVVDFLNRDNKSAILYRNNFSLMTIANYLRKNDIDFYAPGYKSGFFNHWIVSDVLDIIKIMLNRGDIDAFSKIYYKINTYLNKSYIERMKLKRDSIKDIFKFLNMRCSLKDYQEDRMDEIEDILDFALKMSPNKGIYYLIGELGYRDYLEKKCEMTGVNVDMYMGILDLMIELVSSVSKYEDVYLEMKGLNDVLIRSRNNKLSNLSLSTLHSSKGLEFDDVFLIDFNEEVIPGMTKEKAIEKDKMNEFEEARRLAYVGVTRAKSNLHIITTDLSPNCFITEMSEFYLSINKIDGYLKNKNK